MQLPPPATNTGVVMLLSLGINLATLLTVATLVFRGGKWFGSMDARVDAIESRLEKLERAVHAQP